MNIIYPFLKLYICILLISTNIYFFNKDTDISIILLRATWNGNNEGINNNESSNNDDQLPGTYDLPANHMVCDHRKSTRNIPYPPDSPTPVLSHRILYNDFRISARYPTPDEMDNANTPQYSPINDPPPKHLFYAPREFSYIPDTENLDLLVGNKFEMNIRSIKSDGKRSDKKRKKLQKQIMLCITQLNIKLDSQTLEYSKYYNEHRRIVESCGDRNCEQAKILRQKLRDTYSCMIDTEESIRYHEQCLDKLFT